MMNISDKTVSKWERGLGGPDISLLSSLAKILEVDIDKLLSGELCENSVLGGNMKKLKFYVCPHCKNTITAMENTSISCCGKKLEALEPKKADEEEKLSAERIETDYFVSSSHSMSREHYIAFVALLNGDSIVMKKCYPEWDLQIRIPARSHGRLIWYCTQHGLFYQDI